MHNVGCVRALWLMTSAACPGQGCCTSSRVRVHMHPWHVRTTRAQGFGLLLQSQGAVAAATRRRRSSHEALLQRPKGTPLPWLLWPEQRAAALGMCGSTHRGHRPPLPSGHGRSGVGAHGKCSDPGAPASRPSLRAARVTSFCCVLNPTLCACFVSLPVHHMWRHVCVCVPSRVPV